MKLDSKLNELLNKQLTKEFFNEKLYQSMQAWCLSKDLIGFAHWFKLQAEEERSHAYSFYNYVDESRGIIEIGAIDKPLKDFKSIIEVFEKGLEAEELTSKHIREIYKVAESMKDYGSMEFLDAYVKEQIEEEDKFEEMLNRLRIAGEGLGEIMIDQEAGKR